MERKGRGRSFYVDGPKTEKAWEPKVESGVKHLEMELSEAERRVREGV